MRTYEERAQYILKQRDERLAKRRRIRSAVTLSAVSVCSLALIVGAGIAVSRLAGKRGAVWISPNSQGSDGSGAADFQGSDISTEKIYDRMAHPNSSAPFEFTMPEFPGVNFKVDDEIVSADGKTLYTGMPIFTVYLADLNGDGYREICSDFALGSGIVDTRIQVCDFVNQELYDLSDREKYDYTLALEDGVLKYKRYPYNTSTNDTPDEEGTLTLSVMKRVENNDSKEALPAEKLYPRNDSDIDNILELNDNFPFTIPELPEPKFKLLKGVLSRDGDSLLKGYPIHSIYLADLNGDGIREICAEYSISEGIVDMNIFAYDPIAKEQYSLSDTGNKEYVLTFENGILGYKHCIYGESGITTDKEGELTLSIMNKLCSPPKKDPVG